MGTEFHHPRLIHKIGNSSANWESMMNNMNIGGEEVGSDDEVPDSDDDGNITSVCPKTGTLLRSSADLTVNLTVNHHFKVYKNHWMERARKFFMSILNNHAARAPRNL